LTADSKLSLICPDSQQHNEGRFTGEIHFWEVYRVCVQFFCGLPRNFEGVEENDHVLFLIVHVQVISKLYHPVNHFENGSDCGLHNKFTCSYRLLACLFLRSYWARKRIPESWDHRW
jgi:hypothetical protein